MIDTSAEAQSEATVGRDASWTAFGQLANALSGLVLVVVAARVLDIEEFAALNWSLSTIIYLAALSRVGGMQAGTFVTVSTPPAARRDAIGKLVGAAIVTSLAVGFLWLVASLTVDSWVAQRQLADRFGVLVALSVPFAAILPILVASLRGLGNFSLSALFGEHLARSAIIVSIGVLALAGWQSNNEVSIALAAALVAQGLAIIVCVGSIRGSTPKRSAAHGASAVLRTSRPFYLIGLAAMIVPQGAVWLLALVSSTEEVAQFGLAARLSFAFTLPFAIGGRVFFPRMIGQLHERPPRLLERLRQFATVATLSGVVMTGVLLVARRPFVVLFGSDLADAYLPLLILAIGALANTATGLCMAALSAVGKSALVARASGIAVFAYSLAVVILGHWWGATGAAIATAVTMVALNGSMWLAARRLLGIDTSARFGRATILTDLKGLGGLR